MWKVFFSSQSDLAAHTNRHLIGDALERARGAVDGDAEADSVVSRDTLTVPGTSVESGAIYEQIQKADAFVADVSIVNPMRSKDCLSTPDPSVLLELGYAVRSLGRARVVLVINTSYGKPELLPSELQGLKVLAYESGPRDREVAPARDLLAEGLAAVLRPVAELARLVERGRSLQRTMLVAGEAEQLLRDLIAESGKRFEPESITGDEIHEMCRHIDPNGRAPLVVDGNSEDGCIYATWLGFMTNWRSYHRASTEELLSHARHLDAEHLGMLTDIEQCSYLQQLDDARGGVSNTDLTWLAPAMWEYVQAARSLKDHTLALSLAASSSSEGP